MRLLIIPVRLLLSVSVFATT